LTVLYILSAILSFHFTKTFFVWAQEYEDKDNDCSPDGNNGNEAEVGLKAIENGDADPSELKTVGSGDGSPSGLKNVNVTVAKENEVNKL
jgi:hypothetical protein